MSQCIVCHDEVKESGNNTQLSCGHTFHTPCILQWLVTYEQTGCPICREKVCPRPPPRARVRIQWSSPRPMLIRVPHGVRTENISRLESILNQIIQISFLAKLLKILVDTNPNRRVIRITNVLFVLSSIIGFALLCFGSGYFLGWLPLLLNQWWLNELLRNYPWFHKTINFMFGVVLGYPVGYFMVRLAVLLI